MKTKTDLYIQLWINPITKGGLLNTLSPEELHTLIGLSAYIDKAGWCNPSLKTLKTILGLNDIGSVSRRIKKLETIEFEGKPVLKVERAREPNDKGIYVYTKNKYTVNQAIVTIFVQNTSTSSRRIKQMGELSERRANFTKSFGFGAKR